VAGSIYGGMIFYFQDGKVREIFLGAAAEREDPLVSPTQFGFPVD